MFKISDDEYAVLCEIRKNKSASLDRLKMMFFGSAEPALKNLEDYDLIRSDISGGHWYYYATAAGMNYRREVAPVVSDAEPVNDIDDHNGDQDQVENKNQKPFKRRNINWSAVSAVGAIVGKIFDFFAKFLCP